jgi:Cys-tRNA(Pro)/Cys-tRNA(Cys) deacylase
VTPAVKVLERAKIPFQLHEYAHDPRAASYGLEAAEALGIDPASVYKTLLAELDGGELVVAIVPVGAMLNLKALARAAGAKRAQMAHPDAAERSTGYVRGGISPFGQRKRLRTFVDESMLALDTVHVSGGRRGLEIALAPGDLLATTAGQSAGIAGR